MNPWEKYQSPNNATTAPAPAGIIRGAPKQPDRFEVEDQQIKRQAANRADIASQRADRSLQLQEQSAQRTAQKDNLEIEKARQEQASINDAKIHTIGSLRKTIAELEQIRGDTRGDWFETGTTGNIARAIPLVGNDAKALSGRLVGIKGQNAFAALEDLEAKGIKLTPISNAEIELAAASIANLDPSLNEDAFLGQLDKASSFYRDLLAKLEAETGNTQPNQSNQTPNQNSNQSNEQTPNQSPQQDNDRAARLLDQHGITPEQEQVIVAFWNDNRGNNNLTPQAALQYYSDNGLPQPSESELAAAITAAKEGAQFGLFGTDIEQPAEQEDDSFLSNAVQDFKAGVGDLVEGVGDTLGLIGNPLNAGINALFDTELSTDLGQTLRDASGLPNNNNPITSAINKGGAAALTGAGAAQLARPIATGVTNQVLGQVAQQPVRQGVAGAGAGASAETANQLGAPVPVQIAAGLAGGIASYGGAGGVTNALAQRGAPRAPTNALARAVNNQKVDILPADAGGVVTKRLTGAAGQSPISAAPLAKSAERAQDSFAAAGRRASQGDVQYIDDAGESIRSAGVRYTKQSREQGSALYTRAENLAKGVRIKPNNSIKVIDEQIAQLSEAEAVNAPLIKSLNDLKSGLVNNRGVKVSGMKDLRSAAQKGAYTSELRATPANRVLGIVADSISQDIDAGLVSVGKGNAAQAFKTADKYWRERVQYIDNTLKPIIGQNKSGEQVFEAVERMARGKGKGNNVLRGLWQSLDKDEAANVQATIIDRMLLANNGAQNAEGNATSATKFLTNYAAMSAKGKATLFPQKEVRQNLKELAIIAENMKATNQFANHSNTAGAIGGNVAVLGATTVANPIAGMVGIGGQYLTGKLLASPKFTSWLLQGSKMTNPNAIKAHNKRLATIAASEPIIANDIASIQRFLAQSPSTAKLAASEDVSEERPIPE